VTVQRKKKAQSFVLFCSGGTELRSCALPLEPYPQPFLVPFEIGSYICVWTNIDKNPLIHTFCIAGMTDKLHYVQLVVEMECH
jgi:hypothetical protein